MKFTLQLGSIQSRTDQKKKQALEGVVMGKKIMTAQEFREQFTKKPKRKKKVKLPVNTEEQDQTAICNYIKLRYPKILYTVDMAGIYIEDPAQRRIHKQRCKRGHPDMIIQEWLSDKYCGLAIELKRRDIVINQKAIDNSQPFNGATRVPHGPKKPLLCGCFRVRL